MKAPTVILTAILCALPATALAGPHDHNSPPPRQDSHYSAPQRSYSAPQRSYSPPQRSYSAPQRDYQQRSYQAQPRYNAQPQQRYYQQQPRVDQQRSYQQPQQRYYQSNTRDSQGWTSFRSDPRRVQPMPQYRSRTVIAWGGDNDGGWHHDPWFWHRGVAWAPAPEFWGGGFWGDFAIGLSLDSYNVQPESPGAQLLANYGLTQGPCDQDNMVDIYGPDGSQICAYPNDLVAPGQYQIDMSTLSLVSM